MGQTVTPLCQKRAAESAPSPTPVMPMSGCGGDRSRAKSAAHEDGTAGVVGAEIRDDAQTETILGLKRNDGGGDSLSSVDAAKVPVMRSRLPSL